MLKTITPQQLDLDAWEPVSSKTLQQASDIVTAVKREGEAALRALSTRFGDLSHEEAKLLYTPAELEEAFNALAPEVQDLLKRIAHQIKTFASTQLSCLTALNTPVPGGRAGHTISPVESAGCYAPGGRFPLPSSVMMTAVTARAAGVSHVIVASPKPSPVTLAAAYVAGADELLAVGGAQAIAALAYGAGPVPSVDVIVGPGNRYVTAAKQLVSGTVRIDMLAGPSELVILADASADPETIAADLLGQAEHDPDARPILITACEDLIEPVNQALARQLETLPTADIARLSLSSQGVAILCADHEEALLTCDQLAPEHLEVLTRESREDASRLKHYGGLFIGSSSAEVFGDYGVGPNHVLPTGRTARFKGGLSVFDFLRIRTWLSLNPNDPMSTQVAKDSAALARLEGLEAHARSAEKRLPPEES